MLLNHKLKWPATVVFYAALLLGVYSISFDNQFEEIWKVLFDFAFLNALMVFLFAPLVMFNIIFQVRLYNYYRLENEK